MCRGVPMPNLIRISRADNSGLGMLGRWRKQLCKSMEVAANKHVYGGNTLLLGAKHACWAPVRKFVRKLASAYSRHARSG
jgi:hypothetical protein